MKFIDWDSEKNQRLKKSRGISFEEMVLAMVEGGLITILEHPNQTKYPNQKLFVVNFNHYVYLVPFVEDKEKIFLKTIIPSRKATKKYFLKK